MLDMQFLIIFSLDETNVEKGSCGALINCPSSQRCARFPNLNISGKEVAGLTPTQQALPAGWDGKTSERTPVAAKSFALWQCRSPGLLPSPHATG